MTRCKQKWNAPRILPPGQHYVQAGRVKVPVRGDLVHEQQECCLDKGHEGRHRSLTNVVSPSESSERSGAVSALALRNQTESLESPYRCDDCGGWFGVPHDFDHRLHPHCLRCAEMCACRRCCEFIVGRAAV